MLVLVLVVLLLFDLADLIALLVDSTLLVLALSPFLQLYLMGKRQLGHFHSRPNRLLKPEINKYESYDSYES